jgi:phasin family protein
MATKAGFVDAAVTTEPTAPAAVRPVVPAATDLKNNPAGKVAGISTAQSGHTHSKVKESMDKAIKTAEEFVAFGQGNVEAFVKSGQIWAAGVQDISKQVAATAQASFDETMSTFKAITSAKSLKDAFDLQASFARTTLEKTLTESGRLTDASFKLTEQAMAPITARVTLAVEKIAKPV